MIKELVRPNDIKELTELNKDRFNKDLNYGAIATFNAYVLESANRGCNHNIIDKSLLTSEIINEIKDLGYNVSEINGTSRNFNQIEYLLISW